MTDSCNFVFENTTDNQTPTATTPSGTPPCITLEMYETAVRLAKKGHGVTYVSRLFGISHDTVRRIPGIEWPKHGHSLEFVKSREKMRTPQFRKWRSENTYALRWGKKYDVGDGRMLTATEIGRIAGIRAQSVRARVRKGITGSDLLAPYIPHYEPGGSKKTWELGISEADWKTIVEYAEARSISAACCKFCVPPGAIGAMLRGETWRVK